MKIRSSDLILRFDNSTDKVLLLVPKSAEEVETLKRFFEISVPEDVTVSEMAKEIGAAVASFLHVRHRERFKLEVLEDDDEDEDSSETEEASLDDVHLLIARLNDSSKLSDVEDITVLLKSLSEHGDRDATAYLQDVWPDLRSVFVRRLSRKN